MHQKVKAPCKWKCGRAFLPAGKTQHEKFCENRPDHAEIMEKHQQQFRSPRHRKEVVVEQEGMDYLATLHEMFYDDGALFSAVHLLLSAKSGHNVIANLAAAKAMIDLKIKSLGG